MILSPHFSLAELSWTGHREIDNTVPPALLPALIRTARGLEHVRILLGVPVIVLSGYRCAALNCIVGGSMTRASLEVLLRTQGGGPALATAIQRMRERKYQETDSQHMRAEACDFIAPRYGSPFNVCRLLEASDLLFDQLIFEQGWVHASFIRIGDPRHTVLTYKDGIYSAGLTRSINL